MNTVLSHSTLEDNQPDSKKQLDALIEPYILKHYREAECYPGLRFRQGGREMIQVNVPARDVPALLQAKPSDDKKNDPHSGKNRPVVKGHAEEIRDYVVDRSSNQQPWILGTLTANVPESEIEVIDFGKGVCLVVIPKGVSLDITDGQHRTRAIQELIMGSERSLVSDDSFPITLVLEGNHRQCQTDFRDMAQTAPLPKSLLVSFGALGRDGITQDLIELVGIFAGKTQKIKASPGSNSKFVYTSHYVAKAVSCAFTGDPGNELLDHDPKESAEILGERLNLFFSKCLSTKDVAAKDELSSEEAGHFRENCLLGMSVGLEILGRLLNYTYIKEEKSFDTDMVLQLAALDWLRDSPLWRGNVVQEDSNPKASDKPLKITATAGAVSTAVKVAKVKLGWE